jgi:hypothetical protein
VIGISFRTLDGAGDFNMGVSAITHAGNRAITLNGTSKTLTFDGIMTYSQVHPSP